jgi:hypothetical protein
MILTWGNPEHTLIVIDDKAGRRIVSLADNHDEAVALRKKLKRKRTKVGEFTPSVVFPEPPAASPFYQADRAAMYPALDQLADALYWRERGKPEAFDAWLAACDEVKAAHPKPTEEPA